MLHSQLRCLQIVLANMSLDDMGNLMTLELQAPDSRQATRLARLFENKAENVYNLIMTELLDEEEELD